MRYDIATGLPLDKTYLERGLPPYLQSSLMNMSASWAIVDSGEKDYQWDLYWCELNADINAAEVEQEISSEQARYLCEIYLRMKDQYTFIIFNGFMWTQSKMLSDEDNYFIEIVLL